MKIGDKSCKTKSSKKCYPQPLISPYLKPYFIVLKYLTLGVKGI